jgi:DNA polymerase-1
MADDALYIVDGSGFIFRAYHALPKLSTKAGLPSGAAYGFATMLVKLEQEMRPSHLLVVFDAAGARSFRDDLYADYKANRTAPPDDLVPQFGLVRRIVDAFGIPKYEARDFEADDVIATLVRRAHEKGMRVVIVSSDKDLMQLVGERCVLVDTMKDPPKVYDTAGVVEKFGVPPAQLGDVLALMGDSIDNIPGVPGVGPKTASALIAHFGSLEALLLRVGEVAGIKGLRGAAAVQAKIEANAEQAKLSRKLVSLDDRVEIPLEIEGLRRGPWDMAEVESLLIELEFQKLLDRLRPKGAPSSTPAPNVSVNVNVNVPVNVPLGRPARLVLDAKALDDLAKELAQAGEMGVVVESSGGPPLGAALIGLSFATADFAPSYVPLGHRYLGAPAQLTVPAALAVLGPVLSSNARKHIYEAKDAEILLARNDVALKGVVSDPQIASYLIDAAAEQSLPELVKRRLGAELAGRETLVGTGKRALPFDTIDVERAGAHSAKCAEAALALGRAFSADLAAAGLQKLNDEIELPLSHVLAVIERHGICLDTAMLRALSERTQTALEGIEAEVRKLAGTDVNLASPKQLQDLLFDKLQLPPVKKTKTGYSVDADVLEELAPLHPVAAKILEHRTLAKLKGTYLDALPLLVDKSGRLHTRYMQTIAATGRLSSVEPNLQNVPIRTELGQEVRKAFRAAPGAKLVVADYSQIELRVLAHLSKDPVLTDAFKNDQDIHYRTALEMFGAARANEPELRRVSKMINYGIVYGLSDFGLAQRLGIDRGEARRYIDNYMRTYAGLARYMDQVIADAYRDGGSRTLLGRFRPLPELAAKNRQVRQYGERMARNTPIQGTAADLLKLAMIRVQKHLDEQAPEVKMLLTVHDELVLEAPEAQAESAGATLKDIMERVWPLEVPLKVDLGIGTTWADAK